MARYDYLCPDCRATFEAQGHPDDRFRECPMCGSQAERRPFSGIPNLKGDTVAKNIPDPHYKFDAQRKEHRENWGGLDRAVETIRTGMREDKQGNRIFDAKQVKEV